MTNQLATIPFHGQKVQSVEIDGTPYVVFRSIVESIGLGYGSQTQKLRGKSWATVTNIVTVGADGKNRVMTCVDLRTLSMWLATIDENRVKKEARPLVVAYQQEIADVIEAYWTKGGAVNPRATREQLDGLQSTILHARGQAEVLNLLKGIVSEKYLEAKGRIVAARALGETPEINPIDMPLYTEDYLLDRGCPAGWVKKNRGVFGKFVKQAYVERYGREPGLAPGEVGGRVRKIQAYTQADRPLMDAVFDERYGALFKGAAA